MNYLIRNIKCIQFQINILILYYRCIININHNLILRVIFRINLIKKISRRTENGIHFNINYLLNRTYYGLYNTIFMQKSCSFKVRRCSQGKTPS